MNKDSRITLGLALLYFINGLVNLFGEAGTFAPLVFLDSFLLGLLSLVFVVLPSFQKQHLFFLVFAGLFVAGGLFETGVIRHEKIELLTLVLLMLLAFGIYVYVVLVTPKAKPLLAVPALLAIATLGLRYVAVPVWFITGTAVAAGMVQLYILARPEILEHLSSFSKRFYLLMTLMFFFDTVYQVFFFLNA